MDKHKEKVKEDYDEGIIVEGFFKEKLNSLGIKWISANDSQDRNGWDIYIVDAPPAYDKLKGKRIDVKSIKGIKYNMVEFIGYNSEKERKLGWLLTNSSDILVFQYPEKWLIADKKVLREFVYTKIPILKELEEKAKDLSSNLDEFEDIFFNLIMKNKIKFKMVDKEESIYDYMYTRYYTSNSPDLTTRILTSDLENLCIYKINK